MTVRPRKREWDEWKGREREIKEKEKWNVAVNSSGLNCAFIFYFIIFLEVRYFVTTRRVIRTTRSSEGNSCCARP